MSSLPHQWYCEQKKKKKRYHQTRKEKKGKTDVEGYYSSLVQWPTMVVDFPSYLLYITVLLLPMKKTMQIGRQIGIPGMFIEAASTIDIHQST